MSCQVIPTFPRPMQLNNRYLAVWIGGSFMTYDLTLYKARATGRGRSCVSMAAVQMQIGLKCRLYKLASWAVAFYWPTFRPRKTFGWEV